jgi:hypothetical protein
MGISALPKTLQWYILQFVGSVHRFHPTRGRLHYEMKRTARLYERRSYRLLQRVYNPLVPNRPIAYYRVTRWCHQCGERYDGFLCGKCGFHGGMTAFPPIEQPEHPLSWV